MMFLCKNKYEWKIQTILLILEINCIFENRYKIINKFFVENTSNIFFKTQLHQDNSVVWKLF